MFTSGQSSAGGGSSSGLIGLAMGQASKLFDQSNGPASGGKQEVINSAAMMMMKLVAKKEMSGFIGGGNSGGLDMFSSLVSVPFMSPVTVWSKADDFFATRRLESSSEELVHRTKREVS